MNKQLKVFAAISIIMLAACSSIGDLVLPGATNEQMQRDRMECRAEVMKSYSGAPPPGSGAGMNYYTANNLTFLILGRSEIADCLKKRGYIKITEKKSKPPLFDAVSRGDAATVQKLIDNGANVNAQFNASEENVDIAGSITVLMWASIGHLDVVQLLLDHGADVNAKANNGATALMLASATGNRDVVRVLLAKGADVNAKDNNGATALMKAYYNGHKEVVELLIKAGANQAALPMRFEQTNTLSCADKCKSQYNKGEFKAGITIEDCIKATCN